LNYQLNTDDHRVVGFAEFGDPSGTPVITCHGGPGSRLSPKRNAKRAAAAGFRLIGIDRPGYGDSSALPGRSIADWTKDALAVANYLELKAFFRRGHLYGRKLLLGDCVRVT
jgi:pimeloyl-ACP methyl ester carboxylesterase